MPAIPTAQNGCIFLIANETQELKENMFVDRLNSSFEKFLFKRVSRLSMGLSFFH